MKSYDKDTDIYDYRKWQVVEEYLPQKSLDDYRKTFDLMDPDGTGVIRIEDVASVFQQIGTTLTIKEIQDLLHKVVGNASFHKVSFDFVDFKEFIALISMVVTDCVTEDEMMLVFRQFDKDGDGYITRNELRDLIFSLGEEISEKDIEEMMSEADHDGDGRVSYDEFVRVMTNSTDTEPVTKKLEDIQENEIDDSCYRNEYLCQSRESILSDSSPSCVTRTKWHSQDFLCDERSHHTEERRNSFVHGLFRHKKRKHSIGNFSSSSSSLPGSMGGYLTISSGPSYQRSFSHQHIENRSKFSRQCSVSFGSLRKSLSRLLKKRT